MKLNAKWVALLVVIVAAGASLVTRVFFPNPVPNVTLPHTYTMIPPAADSLCASTDTMMVRLRGLDTAAVSFARANGYFNWCVPEYDDDQRFHDGNGASTGYGSVAIRRRFNSRASGSKSASSMWKLRSRRASCHTARWGCGITTACISNITV